LIILIYEISKIFTGPYFILFGLSIGNLDELKHYRWTQQFRLDLLNKEVIKFRELIIEATFWLALFFLLFGYLIKTEIINADTLVQANCGNSFLYVSFSLKFLKYPYSYFCAPRGLILLFLGIALSKGYS
jgi:hypothetical protein